MKSLLMRLWKLPWPDWMRQEMEGIIVSAPLRRFLIPHFAIGVVGVIRNEQGEFLVLKHTYRKQHPWGLPTGFMEHREQPADALRREIREEAGFEVDLSPVWSLYTDLHRPLLNIVFRGIVRGGGQFSPSAEISAARFVRADELPAMNPEQRHLIAAWVHEEDHENTAGVGS